MCGDHYTVPATQTLLYGPIHPENGTPAKHFETHHRNNQVCLSICQSVTVPLLSGVCLSVYLSVNSCYLAWFYDMGNKSSADHVTASLYLSLSIYY